MTTIATLFGEYRSLSILKQRAVSAIVGAAVGDAATRPAHWVYDRTVLENTIGESHPEFWPTNLSPFYSLPIGGRSCYNDEALSMLQSLPQYPLIYNKTATRESLKRMFAPGSDYAEALTRRLEAYDSNKRTDKREPIEGPWQQAAVTSFLKAVGAGRDETGETENVETDGFCLSLPLVARLSAVENDLDFASTVTDAVRILSAAERAVAHSLVRASILRELIRLPGSTASETWSVVNPAARAALVHTVITSSADEAIVKEHEAVLSRIPSDHSSVKGESVWGSSLLSAAYLDAVETFGKPCGDPGNFQSSLLAILTASSYSEGIQRNILAGGCNCSRANFIGAALGAAYGIGEPNGVPLEWLNRTDKGLETLELALGLFKVA